MMRFGPLDAGPVQATKDEVAKQYSMLSLLILLKRQISGIHNSIMIAFHMLSTSFTFEENLSQALEVFI